MFVLWAGDGERIDIILTDGRNSKSSRGNEEGEWCMCVCVHACTCMSNCPTVQVSVDA